MFDEPITRETFANMVTRWVDVAQKHEPSLFVWPPKSRPHWRILQFLGDSKLQNTLLSRDRKTLLVYVDYKDEQNIGLSELYANLHIELSRAAKEQGIVSTSTDALLLLEEITQQGYDVIIFVLGLDAMLIEGNFMAYKELSSLTMRTRCLSVLFFSCLYLSKELKNKLIDTNIIKGIVRYESLYSDRDARQFLDYMMSYWEMEVDDVTQDEILNFASGRLGLVSSLLRLLRHNPKIDFDKLVSDEMIQDRVQATLSVWPSEVITVLDMVKRGVFAATEHTSEIVSYLEHIGYLKKQNNTYYLVPVFLQNFEFMSVKKTSLPTVLVALLSTQEQRVMGLLMDHEGELVSREQVAYALWEDDVDQKYSDWAIDQIMHRLRSKLDSLAKPYEILTKKRLGFMLQAFH